MRIVWTKGISEQFLERFKKMQRKFLFFAQLSGQKEKLLTFEAASLSHRHGFLGWLSRLALLFEQKEEVKSRLRLLPLPRISTCYLGLSANSFASSNRFSGNRVFDFFGKIRGYF